MSAAIKNPEPVTTPLELVQEIENHRDIVIETSRDLTIHTDDDFHEAGEILSAIRAEKKAIHDKVEPTVKAANAAHKAATKLRGELLAPAIEAETTVKMAMGSYVEKKEAEEREQRRIEAEAQRKREAEERELQRKLQAEEDERLARAAELEKEGKAEEAEELLELAAAPEPEPTPPPAPRPVISAPKSSNASIRKTWHMEILNKRALVEAWLRDEVPENLVQINQPGLNQIAKSMKEASRIPGCQAVSKTAISGR